MAAKKTVRRKATKKPATKKVVKKRSVKRTTKKTYGVVDKNGRKVANMKIVIG